MSKTALVFVAAASLSALATPLHAKDNLGVYGDWAAFRDPGVPRCYAIAKPAPSRLQRDFEPFATVGTWPDKKIRGQVHFRLSRNLAANARISVIINDRRFQLTGGGGDAWAADASMDAAIVAAMRAGSRLVINATDDKGRRFSNTYDLSGVATALDAATVGCARR